MTPFEKRTAWEFPVTYLKGVGPKMSALLKKADIETLWDLLFFLPRRYEDRRRFQTAAEMMRAAETQQAVLGKVRILKYSHRQAGPRGRRWTQAVAELEDASALEGGSVLFTWFHDPGGGLQQRFPEGSWVVFHGRAQLFQGRLQVVHPELQKNGETLPPWEFGGFVPVYREVSGISTRVLRKMMASALARPEFSSIPEVLPGVLRKKWNLPGFHEALREIHFPKSWEPVAEDPVPRGKYLDRLAFEELFVMALALHLRRAQWKVAHQGLAHRIPKIEWVPSELERWEKALPFRLTGDQKAALSAVGADLSLSEGPMPMHRLVQGDVGSGKTLVAFFAALMVMRSGYQVAMMAPTEILADQHYLTFHKFFPEQAHEVLLLKGALTEKRKREAREALHSGQARFVIGTQALLTEDTLFQKLGCVIVDEQHRFGVEQRIGLKRQSEGWIPHLLVMTATPIPRSLALTYYGDLNMSIIREKPAGRSPIETHVVKRRSHAALEKRVGELVREGRQIYIVYPLVEESEEMDLKDVQTGYREWSAALPGISLALLHGRMKSAEKDKTIRAFKNGETQILVSTTVIEVGVDVPQATVMIVEHAERFGLSQLHQLRGRVGRGSDQSYCILIGPDRPGPEVSERLGILENSNDGFEISEKDLRMRGPGEFLGRRQSGLWGFRVADLVKDEKWLEVARDEARRILEDDPHLQKIDNAHLRQALKMGWMSRMELTLSG